jgi:hypothetical protein
MASTAESLRVLRAELGWRLDDIRKLFRDDIKITLVIRNTAHDDRDVVMGDDDPESVCRTVRSIADRQHIHIPPDAQPQKSEEGRK